MRAAAGALLLFCALPAQAVFSRKDAGTSSAQFLKLGADARAAGMGEAVRGLSEDANAVYWNPAGLAGLRHRHAAFTHGSYAQGVFYDFLAFGMPIPSPVSSRRRDLRANDYGSVAVGLLYLNAGKIAEVDNTGSATGESFTPQDAAAFAAWGIELERWLDIGVGAKLINSRIRGSASTGAVDAGARVRLLLFELPWTLSASVHNVGGTLRFIEQEDPLPLTLAVGNSVRLTPNWAVGVDVTAVRDRPAYPSFGTELRFPFDPGMAAALRAGWNGRVRSSDADGLSGLAAGAGLSVGRLGFDYAWSPLGVLGQTHRLSVSYRF